MLGMPPGVWNFLLTVLLSGAVAMVGSFLMIAWFPSGRDRKRGILGVYALFIFIMTLSPLPGVVAVGLGYDVITATVTTIVVQLLVAVVAARRLR